jgi:CheY-like chemotaxis protein
VTAYVNIDTEERAKEVGMSKVYNKPLSIDNLLEIVKISTEDSEMEYEDEVKYF